jgi:hypothetical protein
MSPRCVGAQRVADLPVGVVRPENASSIGNLVRDSMLDASIPVQRGALILVETQASETLSLRPVRPFRAPERRCDAVGPFVGLVALSTLAVGAIITTLPGAKPYREVVISVVAVSVAAIGVAAVICNR